jgi:TonB family protein
MEVLFIEIDENGAPDKVEVIQGLGLGLDEKAVDAVKRWTFRPASQNGQGVRSELVVEVPFRLLGAPWRVQRAAFRVERPNPPQPGEPVKPLLRQFVTPAAELCQGASGVASIAFEIGADGIPSDVHAFDPRNQPANMAIDSAAIEAVKTWRFDPGIFNGKPMLSHGTIELACGEAVPSMPSTYRAGNGVIRPELLYKVEPEYSEAARKEKFQGVVVLYVVVDPSGHATNISVMKSLGLGLDQKAVEAVLQWRFNPGTKEGVPVAVAATIEVNFKLL